MKLVICDAHEGLKAAAAKVRAATWWRCKVHFLRNALAHTGKGQRQMVLAAINTAFARESFEAVIVQWRTLADQLRGKFPKLADLVDTAEADVLAFMTFPQAHRTQIHSTNPLERLNTEVKRRTDVGVHVTQRRVDHAARGRAAARAERRVAAAAPLHVP